jgi:hypothetical protein
MFIRWTEIERWEVPNIASMKKKTNTFQERNAVCKAMIDQMLFPFTVWHSVLAIHRLQESLWFSEEGSILYNILIEFGVPIKLVRLIKLCVKETHRKDRIGKYLSDSFPIQNCLKQGEALTPLLFDFASECPIRTVQENQVGL